MSQYTHYPISGGGGGSGTVTSVALTVPASSIFAVSGSPITTSGTLVITTTGQSGGIPYFDTNSTLHTSGLLSTNQLIVGGGAGNSPLPIGSTGTTTTVLHGNAAGGPTFGAVVLTTDVSGTLPFANGGTGATSVASGIVRSNGSVLSGAGTVSLTAEVTGLLPIANGGTGQNTAALAFGALSPLTTKGDLLTFDTANNRLAIGSNTFVLTADSTQATGMKWAAATGGITSVGLSVPATSIFGVTGSPVTSSGTLGLTTTGTQGGIPYFSSTSQLTSSAALTNHAIVLGGGTGLAPSVVASLGNNTTFLQGNNAGPPTFQQVDLTAAVTGILPIANGGTGVAAVTTAPTASSFAGWDANSNLSAKNLLNGFSTTATAAGTTTLTVSSNYQQNFTGTTTQTVVLPVVSTLTNGQSYLINNLSTGLVTVQSSGANFISRVQPGTSMVFSVLNPGGGTGTASWDRPGSVLFTGTNTAGTAVGTSPTTIPFTAVTDTATAWSTNVFTAPSTGYYAITFQAVIQAVTFAITDRLVFELTVNSTQIGESRTQGSGAPSAIYSVSYSTILPLTSGDTVNFQLSSATACSLETNTVRPTRASISRVL